MDPAAYGEDWDTMTSHMLSLSYPLADNSGRRMRVRAVGCDSGGKEGVTKHAYEAWRKLKAKQDGSHLRFILVKGEAKPSTPRARTTWPDSSQKDKFATARGDVPVVILNSNPLKDIVSLMMQRRVSPEATTGGMIRYPDWMENWFYVQLTSEVRDDKGWQNMRKRRNEAFDLCYYAIGIAYRPVERSAPYIHFGLDQMRGDNVPIWFADWDENEFVFNPNIEKQERVTQRKSFAELAKNLA
jgi:phage terminase large subunit GpA-like protein